MSKNYKNYGSKINSGNDTNISNSIQGNNKIDNSVTKNNTKIISKDKNAKKKNKHILPPQEKPTFENGKFASKIDEPFSSLLLKPEINNISFIRPNLEKIYKEGKEIEMFAYVSSYRKKDKRFVLNNLCSESMFLADHILVDPDPDEELYNKIGQCVKFNGVVYKYGEKYSVHTFNITDIISIQPRRMNYNDIFINEKEIKQIFENLNNKNYSERQVIKLSTKLNELSVQIFGNSKFIIGMIFDFYFMKTRNKNLSNNEYEEDLMISSQRFIAIFSDIIFRIESGLIYNFESLRFRVLQLCMLTNPLPIDKNNYDVITLMRLSHFCGKHDIDINYVLNDYIKSVYKRYRLKDVSNSIHEKTILNEVKCAIINILSRV